MKQKLQARGIVLSTKHLKDKKEILSILLQGRGRIEAIYKWHKNSKLKRLSALDIAFFDIALSEASLSHISKAELTHIWHVIPKSPLLYSLSQLALESISCLSLEGDPEGYKYYDLLFEFLISLENNPPEIAVQDSIDLLANSLIVSGLIDKKPEKMTLRKSISLFQNIVEKKLESRRDALKFAGEIATKLGSSPNAN